MTAHLGKPPFKKKWNFITSFHKMVTPRTAFMKSLFSNLTVFLSTYVFLNKRCKIQLTPSPPSPFAIFSLSYVADFVQGSGCRLLCPSIWSAQYLAALVLYSVCLYFCCIVFGYLVTLVLYSKSLYFCCIVFGGRRGASIWSPGGEMTKSELLVITLLFLCNVILSFFLINLFVFSRAGKMHFLDALASLELVITVTDR